jgi:tetratricopeptide (TPR) repeat protein
MHLRGTHGIATALAAAAILAAAAPRPAAAEDGDLAKVRFQEGMDLVKAENYPAALAAFEESYKIAPKPGLLYNIAMCQKALFRYVDSIASFRSYLSAMGAGVKPEMKLAVEQALADMQKLIGTIVIDGAPDGASVFLDDRPVGKTPLEELLADPGQHSIRVEREGYKPLRAEVNVASGAGVSVRAQLRAVAAWIKIDCAAKDAVVHLDGKVVGGCPYEGEVEPGEHAVKVQEPGKAPFEQQVAVAAGGTTAVSVSLADGAPATGTGTGGAPKRSRGLLIGGIAALAVGVGAGALGGAFLAKRNDALDAAEAAQSRSAYDKAAGDAETFHGVMLGGFVGAGVFVAAGVVLIVLDARGKEKATGDAGGVALRPAPGGLAVEF